MKTRFDRKVLGRPRWIAAIVVGAILVLLFLRLGLWQLDRLEERRESNVVSQSRMDEPVRSLAGILGEYGDDAQAMAHRHATTRGRFRVSDEFFSIGRSYDTLTGALVLTPFEITDGDVLIVARGIVPQGTPGPPAEGYLPATQEMDIAGLLELGEQPTSLGESDPADGHLTSLSRVDLDYVNEWVDGDVLPIVMQLEAWSVDSGNLEPLPVPREPLTEGRHFAYVLEWFSFALVVFFGVGALVYRAGTVSQDGG